MSASSSLSSSTATGDSGNTRTGPEALTFIYPSRSARQYPVIANGSKQRIASAIRVAFLLIEFIIACPFKPLC
ncbi:MAG: hypothetical protein WCW68_13515 [Methanothrix sp.]